MEKTGAQFRNSITGKMEATIKKLKYSFWREEEKKRDRAQSAMSGMCMTNTPTNTTQAQKHHSANACAQCVQPDTQK
jgi:hypothetical protein